MRPRIPSAIVGRDAVGDRLHRALGAVGDHVVLPAGHAEQHLPDRVGVGAALDDLADAAGADHVVDLDRGQVAGGVVHPGADRGVDRDVADLHERLAVLQRAPARRAPGASCPRRPSRRAARPGPRVGSAHSSALPPHRPAGRSTLRSCDPIARGRLPAASAPRAAARTSRARAPVASVRPISQVRLLHRCALAGSSRSLERAERAAAAGSSGCSSPRSPAVPQQLGRRERSRRSASAPAIAVSSSVEPEVAGRAGRVHGDGVRASPARRQRVEQRVVHPCDRVEDPRPAPDALAQLRRRAAPAPRRAGRACTSSRRRRAAAARLGPAEHGVGDRARHLARGPRSKPFELHGVPQQLPATSVGDPQRPPGARGDRQQRLRQRRARRAPAGVAEDAVDAGREVDGRRALARASTAGGRRGAGHRLAPGREQLVRDGGARDPREARRRAVAERPPGAQRRRAPRVRRCPSGARRSSAARSARAPWLRARAAA